MVNSYHITLLARFEFFESRLASSYHYTWFNDDHTEHKLHTKNAEADFVLHMIKFKCQYKPNALHLIISNALH